MVFQLDTVINQLGLKLEMEIHGDGTLEMIEKE